MIVLQANAIQLTIKLIALLVPQVHIPGNFLNTLVYLKLYYSDVNIFTERFC